MWAGVVIPTFTKWFRICIQGGHDGPVMRGMLSVSALDKGASLVISLSSRLFCYSPLPHSCILVWKPPALLPYASYAGTRLTSIFLRKCFLSRVCSILSLSPHMISTWYGNPSDGVLMWLLSGGSLDPEPLQMWILKVTTPLVGLFTWDNGMRYEEIGLPELTAFGQVTGKRDLCRLLLET